MKIIRNRTFETNSSSTHSLTICTKEEYEKWETGELYYYDEKLISKETADDIIRKNIILEKINTNWNENYMIFKNEKITFKDFNDWKKKREMLYTPENLNEITQEEINAYLEDNDDMKTKNAFFDECDLETYTQSYITPKGEEIIVFGKYGNDY